MITVTLASGAASTPPAPRRAAFVTVATALGFALTVALTIALSIRASFAQAPQASDKGTQSAPECGSGWQVVASANVVTGTTNTMYGVAAVSPTDLWAVGRFLLYNGTSFPETLHYDGTAWTPVLSDARNYDNYLLAVAAISSNDVWAVGYDDASTVDETLTEHWDGSAWMLIPSPTLSNDSRLYSVTAVSANDVWAVGFYYNGSYYRTLIEHWTGASWSIVSSPNQGTNSSYLKSVDAVSASDIWAVGYYFDGTSERTLSEHWNGSTWSINLPYNSTANSNYLQSVTAIAANDIWAVGYWNNGSGVLRVEMQHWDGSGWALYIPTGIGTNDNTLSSVTAASHNDVWAIGTYYDGTDFSPLAFHWQGTSWTLASMPDYGSATNHLYDAVAISSGDVWAVGDWYNSASVYQNLFDHWNGSAWSVASSQSVTIGLNRLAGVSGQASDLWAVGFSGLRATQRDKTLIEHWNGSAWNRVTSPNVSTGDNYLEAVSYRASNDVWAVGRHNGVVPQYYTLVEHWDGASWSAVSSPNGIFGITYLNGVAAVSATDAWAVGDDTNYTDYESFVIRWNGSTWSRVTVPKPGFNQQLAAVHAVAANDVWAVGYYRASGPLLPFTIHWNGTAWSQVSAPAPGSQDAVLLSVSATSSNDVWAVGDYLNGSYANTLVEHWNGSAWSIVPSPNGGSQDSELLGVSTISATDVYAVGYDSIPDVEHALVEHWNGSTWSIMPSVDPNNNSRLSAVTATGLNDVWAVGQYYNDVADDRTLTERYNPCPATPTPIPTNTPTQTRTPLPTQTPGGPTATPQPTSCPIQFSDVPEGSTFYAYIRCLACRLIVNGYGDGTFKPNNNVTRGQLSKIVSNSAGFSDPQTVQMFQDVPPTGPNSTFFVFIGRLASRGYIGGYACGGPGEPCVPPGSRPYFRPNNNATRGQISKIDSNAAAFNDPPSGQQFQDVAPGSTYYTYTYRLVSRSIMAGYACGGLNPPEPCVPPGNLPYFRPNNNATRGQTSKIVANTFFPGCQVP